MGSGIFFPICAAPFSILIILLFFKKGYINNNETNIYRILIIVNFFCLILEILCTFASAIYNQYTIISDIIYKLYLVLILGWTGLFALYIREISSNKQEFDNRYINKIFTILFIIIAMVVFILPIELVIKNNFQIRYTTGPSVSFSYLVSGLIIFYIIVVLFKNIKNTLNIKYIPVFVFLIVGTVGIIIQNLHPELLLLTYIDTLICVIMYFTIENPDIKMLEELSKNKEILEKNNESTSNFLFKVSQDIKYPVNNIIDISSKYDNYEQRLKRINNLSKNLKHTINNVLDVSSMTTKELKIYDSRYNPKNLFEEIKSKTENKLNNNIKLEYHLSPNVPKYVCGDWVKVKQILSSIIENSIKHTTKGFIELDINTIIKYDTCRFIIDVSDSGDGISIDKVNKILSLEEIEEHYDFDKTILDLMEIKVLLNKMGGNFMIKSELEKGTTVSIVIDQKIFEDNLSSMDEKLEKYENKTQKGKKIMVVDDDAKELSDITKFLEENNIIVSGSLFGKDIIEKLKNNYKFDLIILDDETNTYSALTVLKELQKNEKFNIPVIVMINSNKESIIKHYLKDGFTDIIKKEKLKEELRRILKEN